MKTLELFADRLATRLRRGRWPKHREFAFRVGLEFARAAVDGRDPAPWAAAAVAPRSRGRRAK